MPNWCMNELTVSYDEGHQDEFLAFIKKARSNLKYVWMDLSDKQIPSNKMDHYEAFNLCSLIPQPINLIGASYDKVGYDWEKETLGIKWGVQDSTIIDNNKNSITYAFDSAWNAPHTALIKISADFPHLAFKIVYVEPGMMFCGQMDFSNGDLEETYYTDSNESSPEQMKEWLKKNSISLDECIMLDDGFGPEDILDE